MSIDLNDEREAVEAVTKAILFADSGSTEGWEDNVSLGEAALAAMPQVGSAIAALRDVVNPLAKLQRDAEAQGRSLSGEAYRIANDIYFVQSIAKDALADILALRTKALGAVHTLEGGL